MKEATDRAADYLARASAALTRGEVSAVDRAEASMLASAALILLGSSPEVANALADDYLRNIQQKLHERATQKEPAP